MVTAILVAAGVGKRFGPNTDKLFLEVAGRPVVGHTWARFDGIAEIDEVLVVVRSGMESAFAEIASSLHLRKPWRLVPGGAERQDSVWNGLKATREDCELVAIQDGARPCTSPEVVRATLEAAREAGAAVAAQRVTDTIKQSADGQWIERTVDRSVLWSVQTPQTFRRAVIVRALEEVRGRGAVVTDDTAACEWIGQPVRLVESRWPNPKVTYPGDLPWIEVLLGRESK
ncbi:MAG: 2-C-methyl-D-erythritol 4-phosphate cytidylyltransferase [Verrucomicrobiales bacterium]|nr:2-C-methyl-D-erythritol 4-phosphate cytidylyltransferase [Verrucomicrobiales bacterium]